MVETDTEEILDEKETDNPGLACALEYFAEYDEVLKLIGNLSNIYNDSKDVEINTEKFNFILDKYQEQPHLLDPYLDKMLNELIIIIKEKNNPENLKALAFRYIKHIMKVRGYKVVVRHLPHEVRKLMCGWTQLNNFFHGL